MQPPNNRIKALSIAAIAIIAWVALALQFYITINKVILNSGSLLSAFILYISFFTILTNILVAVSTTVSLLAPTSKAGLFICGPNVQSAITIYIVVVGLVYNVILRSLWQPTGLQQPIDEMLHGIVPILFLIYWIIYVPKTGLRWVYAFIWLIYPALYLIYILIRGALTGMYPYPFVDALTFGYPKVLLNSAVLMAVFLGLGFALIAASRFFKRL